jgi:hypothetical protein
MLVAPITLDPLLVAGSFVITLSSVVVLGISGVTVTVGISDTLRVEWIDGLDIVGGVVNVGTVISLVGTLPPPKSLTQTCESPVGHLYPSSQHPTLHC